MKDMKLVMLSDGQYDDYGISGLYWVPKGCDAHRVIAEAIEAKYEGRWGCWNARELIPSDWKIARYQEVHLSSTYWNEIGDAKAKREKAEAEAKKYAGMTKAQIEKAKEEQAAKEEADFIARGGIRLTRESILTDRTGDVLTACYGITAALIAEETKKFAKAITGAV